VSQPPTNRPTGVVILEVSYWGSHRCPATEAEPRKGRPSMSGDSEEEVDTSANMVKRPEAMI
jgi:hypothetical protein